MVPTPKIPVYRQIRVLVVDDDEQIRTVVADALKLAGLEVFLAEGGNAAIRILKTEQPDLVVTDMCMPDGDGVEVLQAIRRFNRKTVPVVMTGAATIQGIDAFVTAEAAGAVLVFAKPFDLATFVMEIRKLALALSFEKRGLNL
jgi:DNA-binding NtrC family response regulator